MGAFSLGDKLALTKAGTEIKRLREAVQSIADVLVKVCEKTGVEVPKEVADLTSAAPPKKRLTAAQSYPAKTPTRK